MNVALATRARRAGSLRTIAQALNARLLDPFAPCYRCGRGNAIACTSRGNACERCLLARTHGIDRAAQ